MTVYDNMTRSMIQTDTNKAGLDSHQQLQVTADGSVDLFFGPAAPAGFESNWVKTIADKGCFTYFRWYGPTKEFFDKTWTLPDIEQDQIITRGPCGYRTDVGSDQRRARVCRRGSGGPLGAPTSPSYSAQHL